MESRSASERRSRALRIRAIRWSVLGFGRATAAGGPPPGVGAGLGLAALRVCVRCSWWRGGQGAGGRRGRTRDRPVRT
jgi:hypothetical protein